VRDEPESHAGADLADAGSTRSPAYSSFGSLVSLIEKLEADGLPAVMDRSYFGGSSGGLIAQTRGTLRFLDLLDDTYAPTEMLRKLVDAEGEERKRLLRQLAEERYTREIELGRQKGTHGQLLAVMRDRGLNGATAQKAVSFYLGLAEHTGLPVSTFFRQGRSGTTRPQSGSVRRGPKRRSPESEVQETSSAVAPGDAVAAKRVEYIDMLMELARSSKDQGSGLQTELLDRIERALGFDSPKEGAQDLP